MRRALVDYSRHRPQLTPLHAVFAEAAVCLGRHADAYAVVCEPILYLDKTVSPISYSYITCIYTDDILW